MERCSPFVWTAQPYGRAKLRSSYNKDIAGKAGIVKATAILSQGIGVYFFHLKYPLKSAISLKKIPPQSQIEPKVRRTKGSQSKKEGEERVLS
jgi:hypothetical protein